MKWTNAKKMRTFFNSFINDDRSGYQIILQQKDNILKATMDIDSVSTVRYAVEENEAEGFEIVVNFGELYDAMGKIKGIKEITFDFDGELKLVTPNDTYSVNCRREEEREEERIEVGKIEIDSWKMALDICDIGAKTGVDDFDNNIVIYLSADSMFLSNYTIGFFSGHKIPLENGTNEHNLLLSNKNLSTLKKWSKYAYEPKNIIEDEIEVFLIKDRLGLSIQNISIMVEVSEDVKEIGKQYKKMYDYKYPTTESIDFETLLTSVIESNKDKTDVELNDGIVYRPMISGLVFSLRDVESFVNAKCIDSKNKAVLFTLDMEPNSKVILMPKGKN